MPAQGLAEGFYQGLSEIQAAHVLLLQDSSTFTLSKYSSKHADLAAPALARKDGAFTYTPPWRWMPSRKTSMDWPTCTGGLALLGNPAE